MKKQRLLRMILVSVSVVCVLGLIQLETVKAELGNCTVDCVGKCANNPNCLCSIQGTGGTNCEDGNCAWNQCCYYNSCYTPSNCNNYQTWCAEN